METNYPVKGKTLYNFVLKRASTRWGAILVTAFLVEIFADGLVNRYWNWMNRGRLWVHVNADLERRRTLKQKEE